ncbi:target of EGR1 protein 1-like [Lineus longissimus]|uniref:target of EGR1 protein 1-like n=1 Tax=Lineus longissimus TaxID=88925 RepID=UPI002B4DC520
MATFDAVPVIDVHNDNFKELWPTLIVALKSSTFVALDLEMSGLGNRRLLSAKSIEERYNTLCEIAKTRSVVSLGISCFKLQRVSTPGGMKQEVTLGDSSQEGKTKLHFFVQTFNIILLCKESYMVEPESLRFLVQHGFDFNKQYSKGISYHRGIDKPEDEKQSIRLLLNEIITYKVPIALHNGLVDLVFLYHAFYSTVPSKLPQFVSDLSEIFAGGIYDTKYIVEYEVRLASSYLEYVFRKSQKDNVQQYRGGAPHIEMSFPRYPASCDYIEYQECGLPEETRNYAGFKTCVQFGAFGWCKLADNCPNSHDIDAILNIDDNISLNKRKKRNRRKNKRQRTGVCSVGDEEQSTGDEDDEEMETVDETQGAITQDISPSSITSVGTHLEKDHSSKHILSFAEPNQVNSGTDTVLKTEGACSETILNIDNQKDTIDSSVNGPDTKSSENGDKIAKSRCSGHRAGFDAFMTGYTLASAVLKCGKLSVLQTSSSDVKLADLQLNKLKNNVYLSGKDMPLKITKSNFSKTSKEHRVKYVKLMGDVCSMVT